MSGADHNMIKEKVDNSQNNIPIRLEAKKSKWKNKKKKNEITLEFIDEESKENQIDGFHEEEIPLGKDDSILAQWSFA